MDEQQGKPGFRVTDRRRFTATSEDQPASVDDAPGPASAEASDGMAGAALEPVTFSTFVLGMSTQALLHLGEIENPLSGKIEQYLAAAKHVIDILGILRDKTRSNLEQAEERLLDSILYDLRMRYVERVHGSKKEGA